MDVEAKGDPVNDDTPCDDVNGKLGFEVSDAVSAPGVDKPGKKDVEVVPSLRFSVPAKGLLNCHAVGAADFSASGIDVIEVAPFANGVFWPAEAKGPVPLVPGENLMLLVEASNIPG